MSHTRTALTICTALFFAVWALPMMSLAVSVPPAIAGPKGLSIIEMKITGSEFVILHNNSAAVIDTSNYWLTVYNNVNPLSSGVSSSAQQLPSVSLQVGQTLLLSADAMPTCGASVAGRLSLGLTDGGGFLQLSQNAINSQGAIVQTAGDYVSWSSSTNGLISNVLTSTKAPRAAYYRYSTSGSFLWQQADLDSTDSCQLNIVVAGGTGSSSAVTPLTLAATSPPATILGTIQAIDGSTIAVLPEADIGLAAPQISELLPNPVGTGNDATEEFIELYNPNTKPFDLTGFTLQTGLTTLKTYDFPEGTILQPTSFKAFSAADTKLSLSNTSSQASLTDPFGTVISASDVYKNAKDGIGWAQAQGKWFWTTQLTPDAANVIKQPATRKAASTATKKKATKPLVKGLATVQSTAAPNANGIEVAEQSTQVHLWVLALVGGLALLYGAYEYRRDMAHRLRRLSSKFSARRADRDST